MIHDISIYMYNFFFVCLVVAVTSHKSATFRGGGGGTFVGGWPD